MRAIYPGSFDPVTLGHLDIIERTANIASHLIVAVLDNRSKKSFFSLEQKIEMLKEATKKYPNVEIDSFSGLLTEFVALKKCNVLIRGLRAVSDFEYEMQMALVNKQLKHDVETLFLCSNNRYAYLSSSIVKEVALFGGDVSDFVPKNVEEMLKSEIRRRYCGSHEVNR